MTRREELELIRRAKAGDGRAVEQLIRQHQRSVYAFALRLSGRPEIAEDVVQEAFLRVLRNLDRFDNRFRFSTWLFTIAKRLYVNILQKHAPAYDSESMRSWQADGLSPGSQSARSESIDNARGLIDDALANLTIQQREIVLLFHQQNWSVADIAEHYRMPEGTVKSHLHRARKRMRSYIESCEQRQQQADEVWA